MFLELGFKLGLHRGFQVLKVAGEDVAHPLPLVYSWEPRSVLGPKPKVLRANNLVGPIKSSQQEMTK